MAPFEIEIVTLFPDFFEGPLHESLIKKAIEKKILAIKVRNLRDYTHDRHKTADDKPFGGGPGMVPKPEPIFECIETIESESKGKPKAWKILLDASGDRLNQKLVRQLAAKKRLILICGHYEGVDYRVRQNLTDQAVSVGDFITMGGEAPALCIMEAVSRLIAGVVGNAGSLEEESFEKAGLEYPHYTRPQDFRGMKVPDVLISGNHEAVRKWRKKAALEMTREKRPDLL